MNSRIPLLSAVVLITGALPATGAQMSDGFSQRPRETALSAVLTADTTAATIESGELPGMHGSARNHTVWAEWVAPASGWVTMSTLGTTFAGAMIAVYRGNSVSELSAVARGIDPDGTFSPNPALIRFPAAAGTAYQVVLDSISNNPGGNGPGTVTITLAPEAIPGSVAGRDSFASRANLTGTQALGIANTTFASIDAFEPRTIGSRRRTVWWQWVAPETGQATIDTLNSDFDTIITVFAGETSPADPFTGLDEVAANDNVPNSVHSRVRFQVEAGRAYQILIDGNPDNPGGDGNVVLKLDLAANFAQAGIPGGDAFSRRGRLSGSNAAGAACNTLFTTEAFEREDAGSREHSAWWEWTAPADGMVSVDTFGSDFDTTITVFKGTALENLQPVTSNNNVLGSVQSEAAFIAVRGTTYQMVVDGFPDNPAGQGNIALNVNQSVPHGMPDIAVYPAVEVEVFARKGFTYQMQWSSDLIHWNSTGAPFAGTDQPVRFLDSSRTAGGRHYRYLKR